MRHFLAAACTLVSLQAGAQTLVSAAALVPELITAGEPMALSLELSPPPEGQRTRCGLIVTYGDGATIEYRVEDVSRPFQIGHTYAMPGNFQVKVEGKTLFRGLNTAMACGGAALTFSITVADPAARQRAEAARAEEARRQADEAVRARDLENMKQALEAREAELRAREADVRAREVRAREAAAKPRATPPAAPAPAANKPAGSLDVFK